MGGEDPRVEPVRADPGVVAVPRLTEPEKSRVRLAADEMSRAEAATAWPGKWRGIRTCGVAATCLSRIASQRSLTSGLTLPRGPGAQCEHSNVGAVLGLAELPDEPGPRAVAIDARVPVYEPARARSREPTSSAAIARTSGTTPSSRKIVSAATRAHSSAWNVPPIRKVSRRACQ